MNISIRDERYITFPYELKNEFRDTFPRAKWNPDSKEWSVAVGATERLTQWVRGVEESGILQEMQNKETADLTEEDVRRLFVQLSNLKRDLELEVDAIERAETARKQADTLKGQIQCMQAELKEKKDLRESTAAEANAARKRILEALKDVADVDEIEGLRSGMRSDWRALKAVNRDRFDEKQNRLREIRDDLEDTGFESAALNKATSANFNRRDRDLPDLALELEFKLIE